MLSIQITATEAGKALLALEGEQLKVVTNLLGEYNFSILKAIANGEELNNSAYCFQAFADLIEKGFVTA